MLFFQLGARFFGADSPAREKRELQRDCVGVGRNAIVEARPLIEPETREIQLRKALLAGRIRRQMGDALLRIQRANFGPGGQSLIEQGFFFEHGKIVEIKMVGRLRDPGRAADPGVPPGRIWWCAFQVSASIRFCCSFCNSTLARTVSIFKPTPVFCSWVACS